MLVLVAFAEGLGLERSHVLATARLGERELDDPDGLIPYESLVLVWQELVARFPREPLALRYVRMWSIDALGIVGYAIRHARDGHEALALTLRFSQLADPFLRVHVRAGEGRHVVEIEHEPRVRALVEPMEMLVLAMVRMACSLHLDEVRPIEVCLRHESRHPAALYEEVFGPDVPFRFGAPFDGVVFASDLLDRPHREADPRMIGYLSRQAEALLEGATPTDAPLEERVRHVVRSMLASGEVTAERVARHIAVSIRSLQRGLQERGTSFSGEVDAARKELAMLLLPRPDLTVAEIAFMLGYAESRVFHRSFRRWTGLTPTEFRRAK